MRNKLQKVASVLLVAGMIGLSGCAQSPVRNPFAGRVEPKLGALPEVSEPKTVVAKVAWSNTALSKQVRFSKLQPRVVGDKIFAADHSGKIVAIQRESGKTLWTSNTNKHYSAGPFLIDNRLILSTSDAKVVAVEAGTGQVLWEKKVSSEVLAPVVGTQGLLFLHATDGSVTALNITDGNELWHVEHSTPALTLRFCSAPVVLEDRVLVGFATGKMLAFDIHTGSIEWERAISVPRGRSEIQRMVDISADPIVVGDAVYVVTYQGKLASVNIITGDLIWERDVSSYQNMAFDGTHLYLTDNDYQLWAIERLTGSTAWKQGALAERYITGPAVLGEYVVVVDRAGVVHYLSAANGHIINRMYITGKFYQSPLNMGDSLLLSTYKGKLLALKSS